MGSASFTTVWREFSSQFLWKAINKEPRKTARTRMLRPHGWTKLLGASQRLLHQSDRGVCSAPHLLTAGVALQTASGSDSGQSLTPWSPCYYMQWLWRLGWSECILLYTAYWKKNGVAASRAKYLEEVPTNQEQAQTQQKICLSGQYGQ